ncbi:MAG: HlyD family efflux transporter periplasmic adaptor subunit, partial [Oceanobacter sp.]
FDTHIEGWAAQPGQHLTRGQPLVSLHSHDAFEFFRAHARLNSELSLCNERLANLQQRQRSGLSSRLDVMEKTIACQALEDERLSRTQVLEHVPTAWQTQQGAEFDWALPQNGWVMSLNAREGDRAEGHQPLAEFWPDDQLAVGFSLKATLAQAVTTGSRIQVQATNSNRVVAMRVVQRSDHPDASGQIQLWLQPDDTTSAAAQLQPGERWQVAVPSAVTGWVTPASARIRSEGQSWVFERTTTGVQVRAIEPLAEGDQQLLLAANSFDSTPELAVIGTAALTSYWQASQEEAK